MKLSYFPLIKIVGFDQEGDRQSFLRAYTDEFNYLAHLETYIQKINMCLLLKDEDEEEHFENLTDNANKSKFNEIVIFCVKTISNPLKTYLYLPPSKTKQCQV